MYFRARLCRLTVSVYLTTVFPPVVHFSGEHQKARETKKKGQKDFFVMNPSEYKFSFQDQQVYNKNAHSFYVFLEGMKLV